MNILLLTIDFISFSLSSSKKSPLLSDENISLYKNTIAKTINIINKFLFLFIIRPLNQVYIIAGAI